MERVRDGGWASVTEKVSAIRRNPISEATTSEENEAMTAVYRIAEKKCATCRWWNGERGIEFHVNKPFYVKVGNSNSTCMAKHNGPSSAANTCLRWALWEKIAP